MKMTKIDGCEVTECAYNRNQQCHAMAITVGDSKHPQCDTFCLGSIKGGDPSVTGSVGACKMSSCRHNKSLECSAATVHIAHKGEEADCMMYERP